MEKIKNTLENLTTNVLNLTVMDYGSGEAEVLAVDIPRQTLVVQWIWFSTCYDCQSYDETVYTKPDIIPFDAIDCITPTAANVSNYDIKKRREEYLRNEKEFGPLNKSKSFIDEVKKLDAVTKDEIYRMLWKEYVVEDVTQHLEERGNLYMYSEEMIDRIAARYVYDGEYDCNLPYWDNLDSLIEGEDENTINHIIMD